MKKIPEIIEEVRAGVVTIYGIVMGCERAAVLWTAVKNDVFDLLNSPKPSNEVSRHLKTNPMLTEKFLRC